MIGTLLFIACSEDEQTEMADEQELITMVILNLQDSTNNSMQFMFSDVDGSGGMAPQITAPPLTANTTYDGTIQFINAMQGSKDSEEQEDEEDISLGENVSELIAEEAVDYQVFYALSSQVDASISYVDNDVDVNGDAVGLQVQLTTGSASTGTLTITLLFEPEKPNPIDDLSNAEGIINSEVTFDIVIE